MTSTPSATILVVDDSPTNIAMITALLKGTYKTKVAINGDSALAIAFATDKPDLILLDIMMRDMDGYEVCRRLKQDSRAADIPVIFVSSKGESIDEELGFLVGGVDYIQKPYAPALLLARIRTQLLLRQAIESARKAQLRADELLLCLLPERVASEIKSSGSIIPQRYENVSVLFCDVVGFTAYCDRHEPEKVVDQLDYMFKLFERIAEQHGLEKIKTIGDALMCAGGLTKRLNNPLDAATACGLAMIHELKRSQLPWKIRVGIDIGPVVAGIVGEARYQYDIWGSTVNLAARMASYAEANSLALAADAFQAIWHRYTPHLISSVYMKNKGRIKVVQIRPDR